MASTSSTFTVKKIKKKMKQQQQPEKIRGQGLIDAVFSWSFSDVLNKDLYKSQVVEIPTTFTSTSHYMKSFIDPLLEETHTELHSQIMGACRLPTSAIYSLRRSKAGDNKALLFYDLTMISKKSYEAKLGDLIALTDVKPKCMDDLDRLNNPYLIAYVTRLFNSSPNRVQVLLPRLIEANPGDKNKGSKAFVVYLTNLTTNIHLWQALNCKLEGKNMSITQSTLAFHPHVAESCLRCSSSVAENDVIDSKLREDFERFNLDSSQKYVVLSCLAARECHHGNSTKLIWGPPGTGKTKTLASLLFMLLRKKCRTLTYASTNVAVLGVGDRLLSLVRDHDLGYDGYGLGDIILFGNKKRMKIDDHKELHDVFLDYRVDVLLGCLSVWKGSVEFMIQFLENPEEQYQLSIEKEKKKNICLEALLVIRT